MIKELNVPSKKKICFLEVKTNDSNNFLVIMFKFEFES